MLVYGPGSGLCLPETFMKYSSLAALSAAIPLLLLSCKKEVLPVEPKNEKLGVVLNATYLGSALLDSALIHWSTTGQDTVIRAELIGEEVTVSSRGLKPGRGRLSIVMDTRKQFARFNSQWTFQKDILLEPGGHPFLAGPASFNDTAWLPRVRLYNEIMKVNALVGLHPRDPYFRILAANKLAHEIWVSREYWKTKGSLSKTGGGVWECRTGCINNDGDVVNTDFFAFLSGQIGNRKYDHIEVVIRYLEDAAGGGYSLDRNHTFPEGEPE